jgi:hypothetical protein
VACHFFIRESARLYQSGERNRMRVLFSDEAKQQRLLKARPY